MFKLSLVHLVAISTAVSVGLMWFYYRLNKIERQVCTLNQQMKELEQKAIAPPTAPWSIMNMQDVLGQCEPIENEQQQPTTNDNETGVQQVTKDNQSVKSEDVQEILNNIVDSAQEATDAPAPASVDAPPVETSNDYEITLNSKQTYEAWTLTEDELNKKTVGELRQYLQNKEQSTKGNKRELVQRIMGQQ